MTEPAWKPQWVGLGASGLALVHRLGPLLVERGPRGDHRFRCRTVFGADWGYEEERSLRDGYRWSPDGKSIAYWQLDEDGVREMHMIDNVSGYYPKVITFCYPKTGETNAKGRVGVVSLDTGNTIWKIGRAHV